MTMSATSPFAPLPVDTFIRALTNGQQTQISQITAQQQINKGQTAVVTQMQTLMTALQTSISQLQSAFSTSTLTPSTNNTNVTAVQIQNPDDVAPSVHQIAITNLASSQVNQSGNSFNQESSGLSLVGGITLTNVQTGTPFTVAIGSGDSLENIRDNINNASGNFGVTASILPSTSGGQTTYQLVLTSSQTGSAGAFNVTDTTGAFSFSQTATAQNAVFNVDGNPQNSSSNTITNVLDGISFTLSEANSTSTITITANTGGLVSAVATGISGVMTAYNNVLQFAEGSIADNSSGPGYNATNLQTPVGGIGVDALGDSTFSTLLQTLQNGFNTPYTGSSAFKQLAQIGITLQGSVSPTSKSPPPPETATISKFNVLYYQQGLQTVNTSLMTQMLGSNFSDVQSLLMDPTSGIFTKLSSAVNTIMNGGGGQPSILTAENNTLNTTATTLSTQMTNVQTALQTAVKNITNKIATVNALLAKLNFTNQLLTAEYTNPPSNNS